MRVIAGTAKRLQLKTIDGIETRPTTDRIKETLFNMIQPDIPDCKFLDLFSGSGAIGIEALSRGAASCYFVEKNKDAAFCIRDNLKFTKLEKEAVVMETDVLTALRQLERNGNTFDYIFMDPPYRMLLEKQVLEYLKNSSLINEDTIIIVEASEDTTFDYLEENYMIIIKQKEYKTNKHVFIGLNRSISL